MRRRRKHISMARGYEKADFQRIHIDSAEGWAAVMFWWNCPRYVIPGPEGQRFRGYGSSLKNDYAVFMELI